MTRRALLLAVLVACAVLIGAPGPADAQGCAMCRTALGGADDPLTQGIFRSILFLVAVPLVLLLSIGGWLVYSFNRSQPLAAPMPAMPGGDDGVVPGNRVVQFRRHLT